MYLLPNPPSRSYCPISLSCRSPLIALRMRFPHHPDGFTPPRTRRRYLLLELPVVAVDRPSPSLFLFDFLRIDMDSFSYIT